jgi:hypothetical protein
MRRVGLLAVAAFAALALSGQASAAPSLSYTVTSGTSGDNGWYLSDVTVSIQFGPTTTDTTCPGVKTFHSSADTLDCTASDGTAISASLHLQFKIDKDKPTVTGATADRQPNGNGWYNAPVTVTLAGSDGTSGIASCQQLPYNGPDSATASVSGTCRDVAGNVSAPFSFSFKYDSTGPSVSANPARGPDAGGWYNHAVSVSFSGTDATSGVDSCTSGSYGGPDASNASVTGSCGDKAGNSAGATFSLQYDATAPSVTLALARPPDANGWYNHPVAATASGSDSGSGIDSCSGGSYDGAANDNASLSGTCKDNAGNSASASVTFKYDATPPSVTQVVAAPGNGIVTLHWTISADSSVTVKRTAGKKGAPTTTVYHGTGESFTDKRLTNGLRYHYSLSAVDQAGNTAAASTTAVPLALSTPAKGTKLRNPPKLTWAKVVGASYYNVQLFNAGKKILSVWPLSTSLKLPRTWTFAGKRHRLVPGTYRWYVWPGYGPRQASKYGKLLGGSAFVIGG